MTLDELLDLLPDNTEGLIEPVDLRTIVSELYSAAHVFTERWAYEYTPDTSPPVTGKLNIVWALGAQTLRLSETAADGTPTSFRDTTGGRVALNASGHEFRGTVDGPPVDQGTFREIPVTVDELVGGVPGNNVPVSLYMIVEVP